MVFIQLLKRKSILNYALFSAAGPEPQRIVVPGARECELGVREEGGPPA